MAAYTTTDEVPVSEEQWHTWGDLRYAFTPDESLVYLRKRGEWAYRVYTAAAWAEEVRSVSNGRLEVGWAVPPLPGWWVRLRLQWRKSSASRGGRDLYAAYHKINDATVVYLRQGRRGPILSFTSAEWEAFIQGVQQGEFNSNALPR